MKMRKPRRKKTKLPRPVFFVFYNGTDKMPAETIQKLSDSYVDSEDYSNVSLELEVKVININTEAGNKLLEKCQILREYSQFVEQVRRYRDKAYEDGFAAGKEAGVQEGFVSGRKTGMHTGFKNSIISFIKNRQSKGYSTDEIADELIDIYGLTSDEVDELVQEGIN